MTTNRPVVLPEGPDLGWATAAACAGADVELFFPPSGEGLQGAPTKHGRLTEVERVKRAKAICGGCPVRAECLEFAIESKDAWAILGGTTPDERKNMRRSERRREQRAERRNGPAGYRVDDIAHMVATGTRTWNGLADRLGISREGIHHALKRAGRVDLIQAIAVASRVSA